MWTHDGMIRVRDMSQVPKNGLVHAIVTLVWERSLGFSDPFSRLLKVEERSQSKVRGNLYYELDSICHSMPQGI
jgi:hypothetical protein